MVICATSLRMVSFRWDSNPDPSGTYPPPWANITERTKSLIPRPQFMRQSANRVSLHLLIVYHTVVCGEPQLMLSDSSRIVRRFHTKLLPGSHALLLVSKYRLDEKIGAGGFGTVYKATHLLLRNHVAVKVFRPSVGADPLKDLERFRLEGISACRVHHANAVSVIDFGVSASSIAYLVMELLTGCSLKDELDKEGILSVSRAIRILQPICSALAEAHTAGIIHRDVKPSNIFLHNSKDGEIVKVVDFGVAKLMAETLNPGMQSLTETGSFVGTPLYMAPERLTNSPYDGQADVYSIGVMAYEMLCGRVPFESSKENYWSVVLMQVNDAPLMPRKINPEIPERLEQLIMAALSKSPDRRPTARDLGQRFAEFGIIDNVAATTAIPQIPTV